MKKQILFCVIGVILCFILLFSVIGFLLIRNSQSNFEYYSDGLTVIEKYSKSNVSPQFTLFIEPQENNLYPEVRIVCGHEEENMSMPNINGITIDNHCIIDNSYGSVRSHILFSDGSMISMGENAVVQVNISGNETDIIQIDGESYYRIASQTDVEVKTEDNDIETKYYIDIADYRFEATGTAIAANFNKSDRSIIVHLPDGTVRYYPSKNLWAKENKIDLCRSRYIIPATSIQIPVCKITKSYDQSSSKNLNTLEYFKYRADGSMQTEIKKVNDIGELQSTMSAFLMISSVGDALILSKMDRAETFIRQFLLDNALNNCNVSYQEKKDWMEGKTKVETDNQTNDDSGNNTDCSEITSVDSCYHKGIGIMKCPDGWLQCWSYFSSAGYGEGCVPIECVPENVKWED
jgi:hypothetical protein